jgi:adenosine deaminase CECR1
VDVRWLWKQALEQPAMHVRVLQVVTADNIKSTIPYFLALKEEDISTDVSLSVTTHAQVYIQVKTARANFPTELGGPTGFDQWVIDSMTLDPSEAYGTHNTVKKVSLTTANLPNITHGSESDMAKV